MYAQLQLRLGPRERPRIAPDIAVEIWSPDDRKTTLAEKAEIYLGHGSMVVIVVYPADQNVAFHTVAGVTRHAACHNLAVPKYEDLVLDAVWLFADLSNSK